MNCPNCKSDNVCTIDSRKYGSLVRRRRKCLECGFRFSTVEILTSEYKELNLTAVKFRDLMHRLQKAIDKATEEIQGGDT